MVNGKIKNFILICLYLLIFNINIRLVEKFFLLKLNLYVFILKYKWLQMVGKNLVFFMGEYFVVFLVYQICVDDKKFYVVCFFDFIFIYLRCFRMY